jgi:butyrate kinase
MKTLEIIYINGTITNENAMIEELRKVFENQAILKDVECDEDIVETKLIFEFLNEVNSEDASDIVDTIEQEFANTQCLMR